ncbi:MAG: hypothetical protein M1828_001829 [Chrysothrix sp. TS-e1954]|nr:MAG: hypothetical protein M1828_001829 [Chrysothrix sp. TS-e1954]
MPSTVSETPSVSNSFANNFWGKDDAGVSPLLERMHNAKVTGDELRSFYTTRAAIEDEYSRKLLSLARKPLGSSEAGTLRMSLDVVRGEIEAMGKSHQNVAGQMKTELDEQLSAFAGGMKERRKIVQGGIEKLLKVKTQQTGVVNKARDRYEQDCLKIKGYLAQGHMVMGQEERKNKAKLEKTQIQLSSTQSEYETAVKTVEETTGRWNREWKVACDKFQDLEEERIDFMKSSLWSYANIASTVCVSDDASCEKVRLSLEDCDVEKDIASFIKDSGTGQEIPDPPKFINFCRGDIGDAMSEASNDDDYQVAQFQRTMNPAFRSSSPHPSNPDSHVDIQDDFRQSTGSNGRPAKHVTIEEAPTNGEEVGYRPNHHREDPYARSLNQRADPYRNIQREDMPEVPHNDYPPDGMTQFCRIDPLSQNSSNVSSNRPISRDSHSEYSNPTDLSSAPSLGAPSPTKQMTYPIEDDRTIAEAEKKRSGFFAPFRRKSKTEKDAHSNNRNTWGPSSSRTAGNLRPQPPPEDDEGPIDPNTQYQLSIGNNVFDVANPDQRRSTVPQPQDDDVDPIARALGDLKRLSKDSSARMSADRYHGLATPAPGTTHGSAQSTPRASAMQSQMPDRTRDAPPPSYNQAPAPVSRLGAPQPAFTSRQMQQTTQKYVDQKQSMFGSGPGAGSSSSPPQYATSYASPTRVPQPRQAPPQNPNRAPSPSPYRAASPRPEAYNSGPQPSQQGHLPRAASPNPYLNGNASGGSRPRAQSASPAKAVRPVSNGYPNYPTTGSSPTARAGYGRPVSPSPQHQGHSRYAEARPGEMQLAQSNGYAHPHPQQQQQQQQQGSPMRPRTGTTAARPVSTYASMNPPHPAQQAHPPPQQARPRTKSSAAAGPPPGQGPSQFTRDGRPILHYCRALFLYTAAIPEELSFAKNDVLAVTKLQDDGWWEAEVVEKGGRGGSGVGGLGLVPSNYLVRC